VVAVIALVLALGAGLWFGSRSGPSGAVGPPTGVSRPTTSETLVVHVSGAVNRPGLVTVAGPARIADVVAGAGGASLGADLGSLNLAARVHDGDQIVVPLIGSPPSAAGIENRGIDLNRATAGELEALPGVGPVLAERIVAYRELNGPFAAVEDLLDVGGIGEAKLAAMRNAIAAP
jgi:competence protein ComEA